MPDQTDRHPRPEIPPTGAPDTAHPRRRRRRRRRLGVLAVAMTLVAVVGACGSDGGADDRAGGKDTAGGSAGGTGDASQSDAELEDLCVLLDEAEVEARFGGPVTSEGGSRSSCRRWTSVGRG